MCNGISLVEDKVEAPTTSNKRHAGRTGGKVGEAFIALCGSKEMCREVGPIAQALQVVTCQECLFKLRNIYGL